MDGIAGAAANIQFDDVHASLPSPQHGGFMFIGELAAETGIDPKTIRFYEREGLLSPPRHGRFRTYMNSDVRRLKDVLTLRRLGISIAQIRLLLAGGGDVMVNEATANLLLNHMETLRSRQAEVIKQIEETSAILRECSKENEKQLKSL
jgi:DNA-binding transcriptional MerR regulator